MEKMGVRGEGEMMVKFRAGRKIEGARARPLIVKVPDDEMREKLFLSAPRLARNDATRRVVLARDLTYQQREEQRKVERELEDEAKKKTEEEKNGGGRGRYVVVGARGRRRIIRITTIEPRVDEVEEQEPVVE